LNVFIACLAGAGTGREQNDPNRFVPFGSIPPTEPTLHSQAAKGGVKRINYDGPDEPGDDDIFDVFAEDDANKARKDAQPARQRTKRRKLSDYFSCNALEFFNIELHISLTKLLLFIPRPSPSSIAEELFILLWFRICGHLSKEFGLKEALLLGRELNFGHSICR
jgi:hypothetical protein